MKRLLRLFVAFPALLLNIGQRIRGRLPEPIPHKGLHDLEHFSNKVLTIYNIPNLPSYHHALASMIMHLGATTTSAPKVFFAKSIKKAMANQVAFERIQQIKQLEKESAPNGSESI